MFDLLRQALEDAARWETHLSHARSKSKTEAEEAAACIRKLALQLHEQLSALTSPGQLLIFPASAMARTFGKLEPSLLLLVITCEAVLQPVGEPVFSLMVCNAGPLSQAYHPSQSEVPPLVRLRPCVLLHDVPAARLLDRAWCQMLVHHSVESAYLTNLNGVAGSFFYEVLVPHLAGKTFRDAIDAVPQHAQHWVGNYIESNDSMHATVTECLRCLFRRLGFDEALVTRAFSRLRLKTLRDLQADIEAQKQLPAHEQPLIESDLITIDLACEFTQRGVHRDFPLSRDAAAGDATDRENWGINVQAHRQVQQIKQLTAALPMVGGRAEQLSTLPSSLQLGVAFVPFVRGQCRKSSGPCAPSLPPWAVR